MKITVKESTIVKPMEKTPSGSLWLSSVDLAMPDNFHTRYIFYYRCDGAADDFFNAAVMKAALSRALVQFYPFAGRLRRDDNRSRIEINCNGEGVLFMEAECDGTLDDLGGFASKPHSSLVPTVDYSRGISTFPLFLVQLTRFKCGGVGLGFANEHHLSDGTSGQHFNKSWSEIARGLNPSVPAFLDRRLLASRTPPRPSFPHPPPSLKTPLPLSHTTFSIFNLTLDQINSLKHKCNHNNNSKFTTYEVVTGHVWRCVSSARGLPGDQETMLQLPVDARTRLLPNLPPGYLGNAIFYTDAISLCGELVTEPLAFAVGRVHDAIVRMDDEYLRSALDYMELHRDDIVGTAVTLECPNVGITSWLRFPFYEVDFGWGKPAFAGAGVATFEGKGYLYSDPENEGGIYIAITLGEKHIKSFAKFLYDECCIISKI